MASPQNVITFWTQAGPNKWFRGGPSFDEAIRLRFEPVHHACARGEHDDWATTPEGALALIICLDQFPRNLHRGDAQAWAADVKAQRIALSGLAGGFDQALPPLQRVFAYLPLEHAEDMGLQQRAVTLFEALHAQAPVAGRARFAEFLDYARRHREVIARFGRFPHRNAVLGRDSTAAEREYLAQPGAGF